jgi:L-fuculose-phosphate aldolase
MLLREEREEIVKYGKIMVDRHLTVGTFGNISVYNRELDLFAITPSGFDYYKTSPEDCVILRPDGTIVEGDKKPSSEVDMHRIFYQRNPKINAVVHTHSVYATTLSCLGWSVPQLHYLVAYSGSEVPYIPYVQFGTYDLAEAAYNAMGDNRACILGNHGLLSTGKSLSYAMDVAEQIEFCCQLYYNCRAAGKEPILLTDEQMDVVRSGFGDYRKK